MTEKRCENCMYWKEGECSCLKLDQDGRVWHYSLEATRPFRTFPKFCCKFFTEIGGPWWVFSRNEEETWLLARSETGFLFDDYVEAKDRKSLDRLCELLNHLEELCCVGKDECQKEDCNEEV